MRIQKDRCFSKLLFTQLLFYDTRASFFYQSWGNLSFLGASASTFVSTWDYFQAWMKYLSYTLCISLAFMWPLENVFSISLSKVERKFFVLNCLYHHYIKSRYKVATSPARQLPQCFYLDMHQLVGENRQRNQSNFPWQLPWFQISVPIVSAIIWFWSTTNVLKVQSAGVDTVREGSIYFSSVSLDQSIQGWEDFLESIKFMDELTELSGRSCSLRVKLSIDGCMGEWGPN